MTGTVLVVGASGYLGRALVARLRADATDRRVLGTYCSNPTPTASVQFDFWTDDLAPLLAEHEVDAVVYAASVEYGGEADTGHAGSVEAETGCGEGNAAASGEPGDGADAADPAFARRAREFVADCADTRLVYVSSAAVFDGRQGHYAESDPRSPRDSYGRRLVAFEDAVADGHDDAAVLRTSYLFGFATGDLDRRLARTRDHVERCEPVPYFSDMYKSPVLVTEAAATLVSLADGDARGVVHVPTPRTSVYEFHCDAMRALGYETSLVRAEEIPPDMDVAPDRSLVSDRFESVAGFEPSTVESGLRAQVADESGG